MTPTAPPRPLLPLDALTPGGPDHDLAPLADWLSTATIVALGESTHGTSEFFTLKHRMVAALVARGHTVFGIEASMAECVELDTYVRTGDGDPGAALAGLRFWTWDTDEVLALVEWMRAYNAAGPAVPVRFFGFDMQFPAVATERSLAWMARVAPETAAELRPALAPLGDDFAVDHFHLRDHAVRAGALEAAERLAEACAADPVIGLVARTVVQAAAMRADLPAAHAVRDEAMAANVRAWLALVHPGRRAVLWAHNGHIGRAELEPGATSMGGHLAACYGEAYRAVALHCGGGTVRVIHQNGGAPDVWPMDEPAPGSLELTLDDECDGPAAVLVGQLPPDHPLRAPRREVVLGGLRFADANRMHREVDPVADYDVLVWVPRSTASRARPSGARESAEEHLDDGWVLQNNGPRGAYAVSGRWRIERQGGTGRWGTARLVRRSVSAGAVTVAVTARRTGGEAAYLFVRAGNVLWLAELTGDAARLIATPTEGADVTAGVALAGDGALEIDALRVDTHQDGERQ